MGGIRTCWSENCKQVSGSPQATDVAGRPTPAACEGEAIESTPPRRGQGTMMASIQLALSDGAKAEALRTVLSRSTGSPAVCVEQPDLESACAVVVDLAHLGRLPAPLSHPQRVVLIARSDEECLQSAWDLGVSSVVSESDPLDTVVLAILAVCLRAGPAKGQGAELTSLRVPRESRA